MEKLKKKIYLFRLSNPTTTFVWGHKFQSRKYVFRVLYVSPSVSLIPLSSFECPPPNKIMRNMSYLIAAFQYGTTYKLISIDLLCISSNASWFGANVQNLQYFCIQGPRYWPLIRCFTSLWESFGTSCTKPCSVMSVNAEANIHSADWVMSSFVNEHGSQGPALCTQSTRSVRAAVPNVYERDFTLCTNRLSTL